MRLLFVLAPVILISTSSLIAQLKRSVKSAEEVNPPFEVPLRITDGVVSDTLYFGIVPGADRCFVPTDCFNGHCEFDLPPPPPQGVFDLRFAPPTGCTSQGSLYDYRPFTSASQRDTFRLRAQLGAGATMTICWPSGLSAYFTDLTICGTYAFLDTCVSSIDDPTLCFIVSGGLVVAVRETPVGTLPEEITLYQNYPNPFNPKAEIVYTVPTREFVELRVFDLLGREVAMLVHEQVDAGTHRVQFDAEGLPSGVYMYRLSTSRGTITRKMLLLR